MSASRAGGEGPDPPTAADDGWAAEGERGTYAALDQEVAYGAGCLAAGLATVLTRRPGVRLMILSGAATWSDRALRSHVTGACRGCDFDVFVRPHAEARVDQVLGAMQAARDVHADTLLSVGGGGAIDLAKATCTGLAYGLDSSDAWADAYVSWNDPPAAGAAEGRRPRHLALPTTLAGAAHTVGFGLTGPWSGKRLYRSVRRGSLPAAVFLDPEATRATPSALWRSSAFKALEHAVERSYAPPAHPVLDPLAVAAAVRIVQSLSRDGGGQDADALGLLIGSWLALFGGAPTSKLGLSHVLGRQIAAAGRLPHADLASVTLLPVMRFNLPVAGGALARLQRAVDAVARGEAGGGETDADAARRFVGTVERLAEGLGLPRRLRDLGGERSHMPAIVDGVMRDPGLRDNPVQPSREDVERLLEAMW